MAEAKGGRVSAPITTAEMTTELVRERWLQSFCLPNYAPAGWWECDVFSVTKAGYWVEYEIKVSRADFLADARKSKWGPWVGQKDQRQNVGKHDLLAQGSATGPSRFFFVFPAGLIPVADVPTWAGIVEATRHQKGPGIYLKIVRPAPRLHGEKFGDKRVNVARETAYYRFHRATYRYGSIDLQDGEGI